MTTPKERLIYYPTPADELSQKADTLTIHGSVGDAAILLAHARIGAIASVWAAFEQTVDDLIWTLAGIDYEIGTCLTTQMGSSLNRLNAMLSLLKLKCAKKETIARANQLISCYHSMAEKRNRCIHDPVYVEQETGDVRTAKNHTSKKGELIQEFHPFNEQHFRKVRDELFQYGEQFLHFKQEVERDVLNLKNSVPSA